MRRERKRSGSSIKRKKQSGEEDVYECFVCQYPVKVADI